MLYCRKIKAVGWKYFELSDMFCTKTHLENWSLWNEVEKIKRLQVIAEFTDDSDKNHEPNPIIHNLLIIVIMMIVIVIIHHVPLIPHPLNHIENILNPVEKINISKNITHKMISNIMIML